MDKKTTNNNNNKILKEALFAYLVLKNFFLSLKKIQSFTFYKLI
jgi:hypothetical protein